MRLTEILDGWAQAELRSAVESSVTAGTRVPDLRALMGQIARDLATPLVNRATNSRDDLPFGFRENLFAAAQLAAETPGTWEHAQANQQ